MDSFSFLNTIHSGFVADLYEQYKNNPDSVEHSWRNFFQGYDFANKDYSEEKENTIPENVKKEFLVINLVNAYRTKGHLFLKINPVCEQENFQPNLDLENFGLSKKDLNTIFNASEILGIKATTLKNIIEHLKSVYCESIGVEYMYLKNIDEINWIENKVHKNNNKPNYSVEEKKYILKKLNQTSTFESFLHKKYVGQKRFSLEGIDSLISGLSIALKSAVEKQGVKECVIGMSHRGRLNTLVNIFKKPIKDLFSEFEGKDFEDVNIDGDVKYHLGLTSNRVYKDGKELKMNLVPNPSHLESVDSVVQGISRAKIESEYNSDSKKLIPILIHGDGAISGQGIVYEVIQMSQLEGYKVGGIIHIVVNNQISFTTNKQDARSSIYCTDIAKVTSSPVLHINADDVEAVCYAMEFAVEFRTKFQKDIFIDLIGYRKHGHNEGDEPRFTQSKLYKTISKHKNATENYIEKLLEENSISKSYIDKIKREYKQILEQEFEKSKFDKVSKISEFMPDVWQDFERKGVNDILKSVDTKYSSEKIRNIAKIISTIPNDIKLIRKAKKILKSREQMVFENNSVDWGIAENLAYGTLLEEGYNIRISGEDVERGTFSHRHIIMRDEETSERVNLLNQNPKNKGKMSIYNSHLSEYGVLGFDYGYAMASPNSLTIWEAQFGDFANGAQIIFDQYISSAEDKWKIQNGLVVLLPHGYEGQGAEHSSARIERFLQMCSADNMIVANCTTPANIYHLLRRQMKCSYRKPLIVFTPKSLLRHPKVVSSVEDLSNGEFNEVIGDFIDVTNVKKLVFCSGKFYYDLLENREKLNRNDIALIRIEQLFPLHNEKIKAIIDKCKNVEHYIWAQEEPKNMGAWSYMLERFDFVKLKCISDDYRSAPSTGSMVRFKERYQKIIDKIFS